MNKFKINSEYKPKGDQPEAIASLAKGLKEGKKHQILRGVTGSGKTFTMANIIEEVQRPTLILAHNKTLATSYLQSLRSFSQTMLWNTSCPTTTTTNQRPM